MSVCTSDLSQIKERQGPKLKVFAQFHDFSIIQIFGKIDFGESRSAKSVIWTHTAIDRSCLPSLNKYQVNLCHGKLSQQKLVSFAKLSSWHQLA